MALTRGITKVLDIPHEPGQQMTIRKVGSGYIDVARDIQGRKRRRELQEMGGIDWNVVGKIKRCDKCGGQREDEGHVCDPMDVFAREERAKNPAAVDATVLDRHTILKAGIVSWTYDPPLEDQDDKARDELIRELDEPTAVWAFQEIVKFVNETATGEAKKDETVTSTSSSKESS